MKNIKPHLINRIFLLLFTFSSGILFSQDTQNDSANSLSQFSKLIGGEWHLEESYQVFEWGVGQLSVRSKSYYMINGEPKLVSEGLWFWHPGEKKVKGYFTAIEMPVDFFDYTTTFQGNKMVNKLKSYTPNGKAENYIETWEFTDKDNYVWTLYSKTDEGKKEVMSGNYRRINK